MIGHVALAEELCLADQFVERAHPEPGHDLPDFLRDAVEKIDDVLRRPLELRPQPLVLRRDAHRAGIEMALADVDAARGDQRDGAEIVFLRAENRRLHDVRAGPQPAVRAERDAIAQAVEQQHLLRLGDAKLPRASRRS